MSSITIHNVQDRVRVKGLIDQLSPQKTWVVSIKQRRKSHSQSQRGLYFMWVGIIADETGNDKDFLHDIFERKYLTPKVREFQGEEHLVYTIVGLPPDEMSAYMSRVQAFAGAELGIMLPLPEEQHLASTA